MECCLHQEAFSILAPRELSLGRTPCVECASQVAEVGESFSASLTGVGLMLLFKLIYPRQLDDVESKKIFLLIQLQTWLT
jgi:hypothetical protein